MTKIVYSIRISKDVKKMMDCIDLNWQEELRKVVENKVREEYKKRLLREARELRRKMKTSVSAAELIREDRYER
ncbi:type II toxin-antitoxin system VapB family antitoxin [Archaeoglobus sp.]